jgi:hypothetical protein
MKREFASIYASNFIYYLYDMVVREIITPKEPVIIMHLPDEMVGKTVEVIAFEIEAATTEKSLLTKEQRLKEIDELTSSSLVDLSKFKFDRDEANNYED